MALSVPSADVRLAVERVFPGWTFIVVGGLGGFDVRMFNLRRDPEDVGAWEARFERAGSGWGVRVWGTRSNPEVAAQFDTLDEALLYARLRLASA